MNETFTEKTQNSCRAEPKKRKKRPSYEFNWAGAKSIQKKGEDEDEKFLENVHQAKRKANEIDTIELQSVSNLIKACRNKEKERQKQLTMVTLRTMKQAGKGKSLNRWKEWARTKVI